LEKEKRWNTSALIVFAGTLTAAKGVASLMHAWNRVHQTHPDARLQVWGKGKPSVFRKILNSQSKKTVEFKGFIQNDAIEEVFQRRYGRYFSFLYRMLFDGAHRSHVRWLPGHLYHPRLGKRTDQ
jgi:glycosyltransferase involved in cell wall biosynthesis